MDASRLRKTLAYLSQLLAAKEYQQLEALTGGNRLSAEELRQAVEGYPHRLVALSEQDLQNRLDFEEHIYPIASSSPQAFHVDVRLPDVDGVEDLTLSLRVTDGAGPLLAATLEDLHVL